VKIFSHVLGVCALVVVPLAIAVGQTKPLDTLIAAGDYRLHFTIIPGKGTPILFEAGGGDSGKVWNSIAPAIAEITGATVITYDRAGLGKSEGSGKDLTVEDEIRGLETALRNLGYQRKLMLVSHSVGGFYNTIYASRHPQDVPAVVFIDVNLPCFFTEQQFTKMNASQNFRNTVEAVRKNPMPAKIYVTDIVSEKTLFEGTPDADRWKACHSDFAAASPTTRKSITAYETGHYVFFSNAQLVIEAIVTLYANRVVPKEKAAILERGYAFALNAANEDRKSLMKYWHSEDDLNEWGYALLRQNESDKAIEVFKLNVFLHRESANPYDSLADAYLKAGDKKLALENYKKALELNPNSKKARELVEKLEKQIGP